MLFPTIQIYEHNSMIAFKVPSEATPFAEYPKCSVKIRHHGANGFLFENLETKDDIAYVADADDVLNASSVSYGATRALVYAALSAFFCSVVTSDPGSVSELQDIEAALDLANFDLTVGNSKEVTYYSGVAAGNPSGNKNVETIVYKTGVTTILTQTFTWDADDDLLTEVNS